MQSETDFPSSHQLKSYVASKSRLKLAARAVLSADADLLVEHCTSISESSVATRLKCGWMFIYYFGGNLLLSLPSAVKEF